MSLAVNVVIIIPKTSDLRKRDMFRLNSSQNMAQKEESAFVHISVVFGTR